MSRAAGVFGGEGNGGSGGQGGDAGGQQGGAGGGENTGSQGGGQGSGASWRDSLPDDLKNDASIQQFKDLESFAKSYISTKAMVGKKGLMVPGEHATDEEWSSFYKGVGLPELEKYDVKTPDKAPIDPNALGELKKIAHQAGILPKQFQKLVDAFASHTSAQMQQIETQSKETLKQGLEKLKKEWGQGWDKQNALADLGLQEYGDEELDAWLTETGAKDSPTIRKLFARLGASLGEDKLKGSGAGNMGGLTPDQAQKAIDQQMNDPKSAYRDPMHPGHKAAVAEVEGYFRALAGG